MKQILSSIPGVRILGATLLLLATATTQAALIAINPISQSVPPGFLTSANVVIQDLGTASSPSLSAFDLNISYDPGVIALYSVTFGDPTLGDQLDLSGFGSITGGTGIAPGVVNLFGLSLDSPATLDSMQAGNFVLANVVFAPMTMGTSALGISVNAVGDSLGNPLAVTTQGSSITVVPVPMAAWLLLSGMVALFGVTQTKPRRA
jgi:hypothetical protein